MLIEGALRRRTEEDQSNKKLLMELGTKNIVNKKKQLYIKWLTTTKVQENGVYQKMSKHDKIGGKN